jgi:CRISPR/Cas system-associated exonuclease Cas4 (RecB family)
LFRRTGGDLAHTAVVFPNKRASLFFNEHLAQQSEQPIWSPAYLSISDLYRGLSTWEVGDPVKLVCELYKVFVRHTRSTESLDDFYHWGEMLMADFDDADKNLADTDALFANLKDLKDIAGDYSFLDPEQERAIQEFFTHFSIERRTELKERFISMWDALGPIYKDFREVLQAQGIAYEGMLYRDVIARLDPDVMPYERYVFVGFNVLNRVEQELFGKLQRAGKALFYWDYDRFYLNTEGDRPHEAGEFIRRNLRQFGNALPAEVFDVMNLPKEVTYIAAPTENAQARYLPEWLRTHITPREKETAVVLCNEGLLQPVLHAIPEEVEHVNVTMGFPIQQTPVYSFIDAIAQLHIHGYDEHTGRYGIKEVMNLLKHPYTLRLTPHAARLQHELTRANRFFPLPSELCADEFLTILFRPLLDGNKELCMRMTDALGMVAKMYRGQTTDDEEEESEAVHDAFEQLYRESLFRAYTTVNRFYSLIDEGTLDVRPDTFYRLMQRVMGADSIPFHGEPAIGLQVMGVLETRCLDFRHVVMLSVNEGQLPKGINDASFIPYNLRKAFGLTTFEHKIAVFAYYFYRLVQRAEKVTMIYNTSTDGLNRGEWSRFMLQLLVDWPYPIRRRYLESGQSPLGTQTVVLAKTPDVMRRMQARYDVRVNPEAKLSPTALNTYMDCPVKFFYRYVAGLRVPDEVNAEIDGATFGTLFHKAAENVYRDLTARGRVVNHDDLEALLKDDVRLQAYVDDAFRSEFFHITADERPEYNGRQLINAAVIARYLRQLLQHDLRRTPFTYMAAEKEVTEDVTVHTPKGDLLTRIGGTIDRIDAKDGTLRIVDYKTGGSPKKAPSVESLFTPSSTRSGYIFQTFLYASIISARLTDKGMKIAPSLLYIHHAASPDYSPVIEMGERGQKAPVDDFAALYEQEFRERLRVLLEEIFLPDVPFVQTEQEEKCAYCDFKALCGK